MKRKEGKDLAERKGDPSALEARGGGKTGRREARGLTGGSEREREREE